MVAAPYKKHQNDVNKCAHMSYIGCKTTQFIWIQSLIKKNK
jgi:hypothetical protein